MKNTIIYGLGQNYYNIIIYAHMFEDLGYKIVGATDKKIEKKNEMGQWPIIRRDRLWEIDFEIVIVSSNKYYEEIKAELIDDFRLCDENIINFKLLLEQYYKTIFRADLFKNREGLEVGGPSQVFEAAIYSHALSVDDVNFSGKTVWWEEDNNSEYIWNGKMLGKTQIADVTDLKVIPNEKYDFVVSSNNLEHVANPLKAVSEMLRVVKIDGTILLVVPNKETNFDHNREYTNFEHLLIDYRNNIDEHDLTHLDEIVKLHDYAMDPPCGGPENFYSRSMDNFYNRCLHHHVFCVDVLKDIYSFFNIETINCGRIGVNYFILGRKK